MASQDPSSEDDEHLAPRLEIWFAIQPPTNGTQFQPLPAPMVVAANISKYEDAELMLVLYDTRGQPLYRERNIGHVVSVLRRPELDDKKAQAEVTVCYAVFTVHRISGPEQCYFGVHINPTGMTSMTEDQVLRNLGEPVASSRIITLEKELSEETLLSDDEAALANQLKNGTLNFKYMLPDVRTIMRHEHALERTRFQFARVPSLDFTVRAPEACLPRVNIYPPVVIQVKNRPILGNRRHPELRGLLAQKLREPYVAIELIRGSIRGDHEPEGHVKIRFKSEYEDKPGGTPMPLTSRYICDSCIEPDRYVVLDELNLDGYVADMNHTGEYHIRALLYANKGDPFPLTWIDSNVTGFAPVDFSTVNSKKVRWFLQVLSDDEAFQFTIGPDTDRIEMDQDVKKWAKEYHISLGPTHPASGDEDSGDEDSSDGDSSDGDNGDEDSGDEESVSDNQTVLSRANTM